MIEQCSAADDSLRAHLDVMKRLTSRALATYSAEWRPLQQQMVPIEPTKQWKNAPVGMVHVPSARFRFAARSVEVEGNTAW